jgi:hypothetical protein
MTTERSDGEAIEDTVATTGSRLYCTVNERQKYLVENGLAFDPIVHLIWDLVQNSSLSTLAWVINNNFMMTEIK